MFDEGLKRMEKASTAMQETATLIPELLDGDDETLSLVILSARINAEIQGSNPDFAQANVAFGYVLGRLRGRKEAAMSAILAEEG